MENWLYAPILKNERNVKCEDDQDCKDSLEMLNAWQPDDFPCYVSRWKWSPCYKGRRYGCIKYGEDSSDKQRRPIQIWRCWYETLYSPYYWDYAIKDPEDMRGRCSYDVNCREVSSKMIDLLGEM